YDEIPGICRLLNLTCKTSPVILGIAGIHIHKDGCTKNHDQHHQPVYDSGIPEQIPEGFVAECNPDKKDRCKEDEIPGLHRDLVGEEITDHKCQYRKRYEKQPLVLIDQKCLANSNDKQYQKQYHGKIGKAGDLLESLTDDTKTLNTKCWGRGCPLDEELYRYKDKRETDNYEHGPCNYHRFD